MSHSIFELQLQPILRIDCNLAIQAIERQYLKMAKIHADNGVLNL